MAPSEAVLPRTIALRLPSTCHAGCRDSCPLLPSRLGPSPHASLPTMPCDRLTRLAPPPLLPDVLSAALDGGFSAWAFLLLLAPTEPIRIYKKSAAGGWRPGVLDAALVLSTGARTPNQSGSFLYDATAAELGADDLYGRLQQVDLEDCVITASIDADGEKERPDGLVEGHAFSVLQLVEVEGFKLVQLRNPWGSEKEWNGDWSDASPLWAANPGVRDAVGFEAGPNGLFWMPFDRFAAIFVRDGHANPPAPCPAAAELCDPPVPPITARTSRAGVITPSIRAPRRRGCRCARQRRREPRRSRREPSLRARSKGGGQRMQPRHARRASWVAQTDWAPLLASRCS